MSVAGSTWLKLIDASTTALLFTALLAAALCAADFYMPPSLDTAFM